MKLQEKRGRNAGFWMASSSNININKPSSSKKCNFCHQEMNEPRNGWVLKNRTYAQLCARCSSAYEEGTFCLQFHKHEDGWRQCDDCGRELHCGCIMALHTFELNDLCGVNCKECIQKKSLVVSKLSGSSSATDLKDGFQVDGSCSSTKTFTGEELLADRGRVNPIDELQNADKTTVEGSLTQMPMPNLIFLFAKKLTPTDCDMRAGRVLMPRLYAEKFFPQVPAKQRVPVLVKDTGGQFWSFTLRWWFNKKSRKYVLDGTRRCIDTMKWTVGDTLKFYRKLPEDELIMELVKDHASTSTTVPNAPAVGGTR